MNTERAGRALQVVGLLALCASFWPAAATEPCAGPVETAANAGWTTRVECGAGGSRANLRGPARLLFGLRLDANTATAEAFETLPGIGPALAGRLVAARAEGAFCVPDDLERVRGIGPVLRERIAPALEFAAADCRSGRSRSSLQPTADPADPEMACRILLPAPSGAA